ncbi:SphA family protein [Uliginosibacterium aquaticum]|uniref:Transporter n=1 Tax=Uliginosibacterium aquaticum TaxID=2731212 RepID=A0ABX2IL48_9RHOO|nr:transporter [Uliginosibacterium aquaticum]NSL54760.1 transporter [Uliginosibacterium aquaticum]
MKLIKATNIFTAVALTAACLPASATERGQLRALLGMPGQDMTAPLMPGFYLQTSLQSYSADKYRDNDGNSPPQVSDPSLPGLKIKQDTSVRAQVLATRATWLTESRLGEGRLGVSATLPLVNYEVETELSADDVPAAMQARVNAALASAGQASSGQKFGLGDIEVSPFIDWQGESSRTALAFGIVAPTGDYDKNRIANPGAGKFWTFRPVVTTGLVTESGWELGLRSTYNFNTRNTATDYRSGQYFHADGSVLYKLAESWRMGLQGYAIIQTTNDSGPGAPSTGNKARAFALGPAINWQDENGELGLEFKVLPEFGVRNRPEGITSWARVLVRLD